MNEMSDQKPEKMEKPEELIRAEQLSDEGKLDEALTVLNNYEQKEGLTHHDKVSCHLLQCQILLWQGKHQELIKHAEQTYKESEGLEDNFLKVDSLLLKVHALIWLRKFDEASDLITQGEELMKTLPQGLTKAYKQREANLAFIKGDFYNSRGNQKDADLALKHLEHSLALREELGIKHEIADSLGLLAIIYSQQGELDHSIRFYEQSLELFKELNNKERMAAVLNNLSYSYKMRGEFERALECIEQSLVLHQEVGNLGTTASCYDFLIQILIDKGDLERAQQSLYDFEQLNNQLKDKQFNLMCLF